MVMEVKVDPNKSFEANVKNIVKDIEDLTIPLRSITRQWYKGNKSIFTLGGPGKYQDLTDSYERWKQKNVGFVYPLLKAKNGRIEKSITDPRSRYALNYIINKKTLVLGVNVFKENIYARAIHYGYAPRNLPPRPYLFLGPEKQAPKELKNRGKTYLNILVDYVKQVWERS